MGHRLTPHPAQAHRAPRLEPAEAAPRSPGAASVQWCYLYAFVHPPSGRTVWLLLPTVSVAAFTIALSELAQVDVPRGLPLHVLSLYAPDPQSAERLWHLTNEALANRHFHDLDDLQEVQVQRCLTLQTMPEFIRAHTNFHWWPQTA